MELEQQFLQQHELDLEAILLFDTDVEAINHEVAEAGKAMWGVISTQLQTLVAKPFETLKLVFLHEDQFIQLQKIKSLEGLVDAYKKENAELKKLVENGKEQSKVSGDDMFVTPRLEFANPFSTPTPKQRMQAEQELKNEADVVMLSPDVEKMQEDLEKLVLTKEDQTVEVALQVVDQLVKNVFNDADGVVQTDGLEAKEE